MLPLRSTGGRGRLLSSVEGGTMPPSTDLLQGTLDMLILRAVATQALHGWAIAQRIQEV